MILFWGLCHLLRELSKLAMAENDGLEPPHDGVKFRCLTIWLVLIMAWDYSLLCDLAEFLFLLLNVLSWESQLGHISLKLFSRLFAAFPSIWSKTKFNFIPFHSFVIPHILHLQDCFSRIYFLMQPLIVLETLQLVSPVSFHFFIFSSCLCLIKQSEQSPVLPADQILLPQIEHILFLCLSCFINSPKLFQLGAGEGLEPSTSRLWA